MGQIYKLFPSVASVCGKKSVVAIIVVVDDLPLKRKRLFLLAYSFVYYSARCSPVKGPSPFWVVFDYWFFCRSAHGANIIKNVRYAGGLGYI